jgi:hypothetical protein
MIGPKALIKQRYDWRVLSNDWQMIGPLLLFGCRSIEFLSPPKCRVMRLTAEVILNARAHINPLRERELDLRGNHHALYSTTHLYLFRTLWKKTIYCLPVHVISCHCLGYKIPVLENLGATKVRDPLSFSLFRMRTKAIQ